MSFERRFGGASRRLASQSACSLVFDKRPMHAHG
jgi:hypothetical protein